MIGSKVNISLNIDNYNLDINIKDILILNTFEEIIKECFNDKKDFIIARVESIPICLTKDSYYEYFWANSLNRILFKINKETNNIIKYNIKNPRDNSFIFGKVDYYKIKNNKILLLYLLTGRKRYLTQLKRKTYLKQNYNNFFHLIIESEYFASDFTFINKEECRKYFKLNLNESEVCFLYENNNEKINSNLIEEVNIKLELWKHKKIIFLQYFLWFSVIFVFILLFGIFIFPNLKNIIIIIFSFFLVFLLFYCLYTYWIMKLYYERLNKIIKLDDNNRDIIVSCNYYY